MNIRKTTLMLVVALLSALSLCAAEPSEAPVRWRTIIRTTGPSTGTVIFKALIAPGWHLYGLDLPDGGPVPTSFDVTATGLEFTSEVTPSRPAMVVDDPLFGMKLSWWDQNVEFSIPFKMKNPAEANLKCEIRYMACDGNTCRPPAIEKIATPVKLKQTK